MLPGHVPEELEALDDITLEITSHAATSIEQSEVQQSAPATSTPVNHALDASQTSATHSDSAAQGLPPSYSRVFGTPQQVFELEDTSIRPAKRPNNTLSYVENGAALVTVIWTGIVCIATLITIVLDGISPAACFWLHVASCGLVLVMQFLEWWATPCVKGRDQGCGAAATRFFQCGCVVSFGAIVLLLPVCLSFLARVRESGFGLFPSYMCVKE
ncbi:hypothetical protein IWX50DRAFT_645421 [Phyllosticta citricarpa]|uniref:Transmembrane protein n=1 Tax=Phyllosticta citricarpa TaxID=55181 RepID=A0ABR1LGZ3_9PEZI